MGSSAQAGTKRGTPSTRNGGGTRPAITLCPLHPQDALWHKWQLGGGLPPASAQAWQRYDEGDDADVEMGTNVHLRLSESGLNSSGKPWECRLSFEELARSGGMVLGRCPFNAHIRLPHENVSRRHALLEIADNGLVITDMGSTNGTFVNGHKLSPYDRRVPLANGMTVTIGTTGLRLEYIRSPRYFLH